MFETVTSDSGLAGTPEVVDLDLSPDEPSALHDKLPKAGYLWCKA